jgi:hypothetical protein
MEYKVVRLVASLQQGETVAYPVEQSLNTNSAEGWTLHSQSMWSHIMFENSSHEIAVLIYHRDAESGAVREQDS